MGRQNPETAVLYEAQLIKDRLANDREFKICVLDPNQKGQDCNAFWRWLTKEAEDTSMNKDMWLKFIERILHVHEETWVHAYVMRQCPGHCHCEERRVCTCVVL